MDILAARRWLAKRMFTTIKKKSVPKFYKEYKDLLEKSQALEMVVPKQLNSIDELKDCGLVPSNTDSFASKLPKGTQAYDLEGYKRCVSTPVYDLLNRGGKRWRPIYGLILANDFGMDIRNLEKSKLLYYLLGAWEMFHNSSLIMDDIEDGSLKRRGDHCIHIKYGEDIAVNTGSLINFMWFSRLHLFLDLSDPKYVQLMNHMIIEIANMHFGQNWDIDWHRGNHMPTEQNYYQMASSKTGVNPRLITKLVCALNNINEKDTSGLCDMINKASIAFQIKDDVLSLESTEYADARGIFGEDMHEGKRSLIVIHSYRNLDEKNKSRLLEILNMKTKDKNLIKEAIDLVNFTKSIDYAKKAEKRFIKSAMDDAENYFQKKESKDNFKKFMKIL